MKQLQVYNLEFPDYVYELNIGGYLFARVAKYAEALQNLQQRADVSGSEFPIKPTTGAHQITAIVTLPEAEPSACLPWDNKMKATSLQDILLLLTLFTGRNVFALAPLREGEILTPDPRVHKWGGQFHLSVREESRWQHRETGELVTDAQMQERYKADYDLLNLGLETTVNEVLATITDASWREEYGSGYFLFTYRQAVRQDNLEPAFLLCWTIWEHIFAVHNSSRFDASAIEQTSGDKKVAFILHNYLLVSIDDSARAEIKRIARARNRLVHFGQVPDTVDYEEMAMFIRLTEQIMAIVLRLEPSNAFNSLDRLKSFLRQS